MLFLKKKKFNILKFFIRGNITIFAINHQKIRFLGFDVVR